MTIRHLGPYAGQDVENIAKLDEATKLWTDGYDIDITGQRHA